MTEESAGAGANEAPIVYRPNTATGVFLGGIFLATAAVLVWVGSVLVPQDREALDGLTLLLFTVVPFKLFCWVMGGVFVAIGGAIMRRALRGAPVLVATDRGLTLPDGTTAAWRDVSGIEVAKNGMLSVEVGEHAVLVGDGPTRAKLPAWLGGRRRGGKISLSSFDLGADPAEVGALLEAWRERSSGSGSPEDGEAE